MSVDTWDKNEIKKLASISGKPLEVECADKFAQAGWQVTLGTYYQDVASEKVRELDVLIQKTQEIVVGDFKYDVSIRVLGSCKGFPAGYGPITYSVLQNSRSVHGPIFMYRSRRSFGDITPQMAWNSAAHFLQNAKLNNSKQVVGFDIYCREENKRSSAFEYSRKTDRDLYEGLDSAIKAAVYWDAVDANTYHRDRVHSQKRGHATLNIPLLITSLPFWNVAMDQGKSGEPELTYSGYHVGLYPFADEEHNPKPVMSLLWAASKLQDLTHSLNVLHEELVDETKFALQKIAGTQI